MLEALDWLFHFLHLAVILVNTSFWWWQKTLLIAQISLGLTFISWIGFGFFYGFGYCFLTEWHWQIKIKNGDTNLPYSYIKLVMDRATGGDWPAAPIDTATAVVIGGSIIGCLIQTWRFRSKTY